LLGGGVIVESLSSRKLSITICQEDGKRCAFDFF
jgi:hypothetical protein